MAPLVPHLWCTHCGEAWELAHVVHDAPEQFPREGSRITACPWCAKGHRISKRKQRIAKVAAAIADVCGSNLRAAGGLTAKLVDLGL